MAIEAFRDDLDLEACPGGGDQASIHFCMHSYLRKFQKSFIQRGVGNSDVFSMRLSRDSRWSLAFD